jgi:ferredoxin--NADP+ reductase
MEDADVIVDPGRGRARPASAAYLESDEADKTTRVNVETLREFSRRAPEGKKQRSSCASSPRRRDQGRRQGRSDRRRPQRAGRGGRHAAAKDSGEREELECGLVLRSVGYTGVPIEGVPSTRSAA